MADRVPVLLEGGPCDGRKTTARRADFGPVAVTCKGVTYEPTTRVTSEGRIVYKTKASLKPPPPPPAGPVDSPNRAHTSWHGMLRSMFVDVPKELARSADVRKSMRRLTERRGLR